MLVIGLTRDTRDTSITVNDNGKGGIRIKVSNIYKGERYKLEEFLTTIQLYITFNNKKFLIEVSKVL